MSICARTLKVWGSYDENGQWQREKFCFVSCGSRCDCMPPLTNPVMRENDIIFSQRNKEGEKLE